MGWCEGNSPVLVLETLFHMIVTLTLYFVKEQMQKRVIAVKDTLNGKQNVDEEVIMKFYLGKISQKRSNLVRKGFL